MSSPTSSLAPFGSIGTRRYTTLLAATLVTLVTMALPSPYHLISNIGFSLVILLQIRLLAWSGSRGVMSRLFRLLGGMTLVAQWLWLLTPADLRSSGVPLLVMLTLFEVQAYPRLVHRLSLEKRVTTDVLNGALSGYLLLGLTAALVIALLESIVPGSFAGLLPAVTEGSAGGPSDTPIREAPFITITYFAFVTLTTLGYGDVLPVTPLAKLTVILFSVIGPVYLAVIMGVLIGRYLQDETSGQQ
jgi:hypothetical protein